MISFGEIKIVPTIDEHIPSFWEILREWPNIPYEDYWKFCDWFQDTALESLTALDNGQVVGCGYLDQVYPGYYATIAVFKKRGYLNPKMVAAVCKEGLPYFFERNDLEKLIALVEVGQKASLKLVKRLGFRKVGVVCHHTKVNGKWADFVWYEILREQVNKRS